MNMNLSLNTQTFVAAVAALLITGVSTWAFVDATRSVPTDLRPSDTIVMSTGQSSHGADLS